MYKQYVNIMLTILYMLTLNIPMLGADTPRLEGGREFPHD